MPVVSSPMDDPQAIATARTAGAPALTRSRLPACMLAFYAVFWAALAISPLDRTDWLLENLLVFAGVAWLVWRHRSHPLSNASYAFITVFFCLHTIGSHYTYSETPIGFWISDLAGLERNHYDRIVHFSFGLLMCYPLQEVIARTAQPKGGWPLAFAVMVVCTFSLAYETIEWAVAAVVSPDAAMAFLGTQGDDFDAQKDGALAALGSIITAAAIHFIHTRRSSGTPG